jgi:hypothetical protein
MSRTVGTDIPGAYSFYQDISLAHKLGSFGKVKNAINSYDDLENTKYLGFQSILLSF